MALGLLGKGQREALMALYGYARYVDDLGDEEIAGSAVGSEDRLALLAAARAELEAAQRGEATHPVFARLTPLFRQGLLAQATLARLIAANVLDQHRRRYETFEDLLGYCALSANPIGEAVLQIFGRARPKLVALSDSVCSALQVVEHLQDIGEDARRGRCYLPQADLERFGGSERDLLMGSATPALRRTVAAQARRARELLGAATELSSRLGGSKGLAVAAFAAGGHAALDRIERAGFDTLCAPARPSTTGLARHTAAISACAWRLRSSLPPEWSERDESPEPLVRIR